MYNFRKLVLGYAPTRRFDFPEPAEAYANSIKIKKRVYEILDRLGDIEIVDLDFLNSESLLYQECDVQKVVDYFKEKKVDALFVPHTNFGNEEAVVKLCRALRVPVLIWGPRDEMPPQAYCYRQTDTQCGLFATTMDLLREHVPFSYIENCWMDSPVLEEKLDIFVRAACVVKAVRDMKVLKLGPRPRDFLCVMTDEAGMIKELGIDLFPVDGTELVDEMNRIMKNQPERIQALVEETRNKFCCYTITPEKAENLAAVELAILDIAERNGCTVAAGDCWYALKLAYETNPCFAFGNLTEKGLPVACETDVYGAITAGILQAVARYDNVCFTADMTIRHPENDNTELLWHCGPFPRSLADESCNPELNDSCMGRYELKQGEMTLARLGCLDGKFSLFIGEGKTVPGPITGGNYVWFEADDWEKWERHLIYGPYVHHICGIFGKYAKVLEEACRYMNITADPIK